MPSEPTGPPRHPVRARASGECAAYRCAASLVGLIASQRVGASATLASGRDRATLRAWPARRSALVVGRWALRAVQPRAGRYSPRSNAVSASSQGRATVAAAGAMRSPVSVRGHPAWSLNVAAQATCKRDAGGIDRAKGATAGTDNADWHGIGGFAEAPPQLVLRGPFIPAEFRDFPEPGPGCRSSSWASTTAPLRSRCASAWSSSRRRMPGSACRTANSPDVIGEARHRLDVQPHRALLRHRRRRRPGRTRRWLQRYHGLGVRLASTVSITTIEDRRGRARVLGRVGPRLDGARRAADPRPAQGRLPRSRRNAGTTGVLLNRLFQATFSVAKRVRTETRIGASAVSVASAAVALARTRVRRLRQPHGAAGGRRRDCHARGPAPVRRRPAPDDHRQPQHRARAATGRRVPRLRDRARRDARAPAGGRHRRQLDGEPRTRSSRGT